MLSRKQWGKIGQALFEDQHDSAVTIVWFQGLRCFKQKVVCFPSSVKGRADERQNKGNAQQGS